MKTVEKKVYYCEFCKKHGLSASSMARHEKRCTGNIDRECHWGEEYRPYGNNRLHEINYRSMKVVLANFTKFKKLNKDALDSLHDAVNGCPACMLTIIRCSKRGKEVGSLWNYSEEVERFREYEREESQRQELYDLERSWI